MKTKTGTFLTRCMIVLWYAFFGSSVLAQDEPTGRVILEVAGAIDHTNGDNIMRYDRPMLEALGLRDIVTETPWTDGPATFTGVLARDLLANVGATGTTIFAIALNDYGVEIPITDFETFDVILALRKDGEYLTVRDRGPLWVIYPWSDFTDLQNELYYSRSIWQLRTLDVRPN